MNKDYGVYFIGILLLGFFYYPIKQYINDDTVFVIAAISYLLILRYIASRVNNGRRSKSVK